jgi:hypothetical protein
MSSIDSNTSTPTAKLDFQAAGEAAAVNLEQTYKTAGAGPAAAKLQEEYLDYLRNPVKDGRNLAPMDYELTKLNVDSSKGDETLEAAAVDWGIANLPAAIDQESVHKLSGADEPAENGATTPLTYEQLMYSVFDREFNEISGIGHTSLDSMAPPQITQSDLYKVQEVDEVIRTMNTHPLPPPPAPSFLQKVEEFFGLD